MFATLHRPKGVPGHESRSAALALLSAIDAAISPAAGGGDGTPGSLSPVAYFGSVLSVVESQDVATTSPAEIDAAMTLLECVVPAAPEAAVAARFGDAAAAVLPLAGCDDSRESAAALLKKVVAVLASLLRAFTSARGAAAWGDDQVRVFNALLTLTASARPKVRKRAVAEVVTLASMDGVSHRKHLVGTQAVKFVKHVVAGCGAADVLPALHALYAAARFAPYLSTASSFELISTLLKLPAIGSPMLTVKSFDTIAALFDSPDCAISHKNVGATVAALWDLQPSQAEADQTAAHGRALTAAQARLTQIDERAGRKRLAKTVSVVFGSMLSDRREVLAATAASLRVLAVDCISDEMIMEGVEEARGERVHAIEGAESAVAAVVRIFRAGLGFRYAHAHDLILLVTAALFERLGDAARYLMREVLIDLGEMWDTAPSQIREELTLALGEAVAAMGPVPFLEVIPMNLEKMLADGASPQDKSIRDWLLPLFRDHIRATRLADFGQHFLSLAHRVAQRAAALEAEGKRAIEAKTLRIVYTQIWATFPAFCVYPTDVTESFPKLARAVGAAIAQEPLVRQYATQGLQAIIDNLVHAANANLGENAQRAGLPTREQALAQIEVVKPFAKNFLPVLLNAYRAMAGDGTGTHREYVLRCVRSYAGIAGDALTNDVFRSAVRKLLESAAGAAGDEASEREQVQFRCDMIDIAMSVVELLDDESAGLLQRVAVPQALGSDASLQKRSYNVLARLCARKGFLETHGEELVASLVVNNSAAGDAEGNDAAASKRRRGQESTESILAGTLSAAITTAAKRPRMRVLRYLVAGVNPAAARELVAAVLPEVVLCTRESNSEARAEAFDLLVAFGHRLAGGEVDLPPQTGGGGGGGGGGDVATGEESLYPAEFEAGNGNGGGSNHHQRSKGPRRGWTPADDDAALHAPEGAVDGLRHYLELLVATLAAKTPRMIAAGVTALSRVLYEFAPLLAPSTNDLIEAVLVLFSHNAREVGGALLGFCKVATAACDPPTVSAHIPAMVEGALRWGNASKALKLRARTVIERLVRRFGVDVVSMAMPESDMRLLQHIRRMNDRHERDKKGRVKADSRGATPGERSRGFDALLDDTDDEDGPNPHGKRQHQQYQREQEQYSQQQHAGGKRRRDGGAASSYIREGTGNDTGGPVDLLDSRQMMASVSTVRPGARGAAASSNAGSAVNIRRTRDGRLVVPDDPEDHSAAKRRRRGGDDDDGDDANNHYGPSDPTAIANAEMQAAMDVETAGENIRTAAKRGNRGLKLRLQSDATASGSTTWSSALERKVRAGTSGAAVSGPSSSAGQGARGGGGGGKGKDGYGTAYKPRRPGTGGDVKLKNKPDPYAFVPLSAPPKRAGPVGKIRDKGLAKLVSSKSGLGQATRARRVAQKRKGGGGGGGGGAGGKHRR